jgi:hypothetical protein
MKTHKLGNKVELPAGREAESHEPRRCRGDSAACIDRFGSFLEEGGTLEGAQNISDHADSRTTKLYDRRQEVVLREDVEGDSVLTPNRRSLTLLDRSRPTAVTSFLL